MTQRITSVALLVREYDEAIAFYRDALGFAVLTDTDLGEGKRWVEVAPPGGTHDPGSGKSSGRLLLRASGFSKGPPAPTNVSSTHAAALNVTVGR